MNTPYKIVGDCNEASAGLTGEDGFDKATLCRLFASQVGDDHPTLADDEWQRMVYLVDSAPDLLEALEDLLFTAEALRETLDGFEGFTGEPASLGKARAAIAKARGNG